MRISGVLEFSAPLSPSEAAERIAEALRLSGAFRVASVGSAVTFSSASLKNAQPPLQLVNGRFCVVQTASGVAVRYGAKVALGPLLLLYLLGGVPLLLVAVFTGEPPLAIVFLAIFGIVAGISVTLWAAVRWMQTHARSVEGT